MKVFLANREAEASINEFATRDDEAQETAAADAVSQCGHASEPGPWPLVFPPIKLSHTPLPRVLSHPNRRLHVTDLHPLAFIPFITPLTPLSTQTLGPDLPHDG